MVSPVYGDIKKLVEQKDYMNANGVIRILNNNNK